MQGAPKVQYIICTRGGYHTGQVLNMVCLEQKCTQQQLCCCACVQQNHKNHNTKPLRLVMLEAEQTSSKITPVKFNIDIALELLQSHHQESIQIFAKHKKEFITSINQIESTLHSYYDFLSEQLRIKNIDPKIQIKQAFETVQLKIADPVKYTEAVKRISGLLNAKKDEGELTEVDIIDSLKSNNNLTKEKLQQNIDEVGKLLQKYQKELSQSINNAAIWKSTAFKFSPTLKHPDIKILGDFEVKSTNNSGYKFAIMQPNIQKNNMIQKMTFKIRESSSNWVAVGACHPKIVSSKNYGFNFSSIGHGAYMVSANGGSWSHTKAEQNNSVKAFKYGKGDIIQVILSPQEKMLTFKKNTQTYQIPYENIANDQLCPCVLFYYLNDQVEFLPNYKG